MGGKNSCIVKYICYHNHHANNNVIHNKCSANKTEPVL